MRARPTPSGSASPTGPTSRPTPTSRTVGWRASPNGRSNRFSLRSVRMQLVLERARDDRLTTSGWYRIGDGFLQIDSDYGPLVEAAEAWYGECRVADAEPGLPFVQCRAGVLPGS